jgi:hypothetical protein
MATFLLVICLIVLYNNTNTKIDNLIKSLDETTSILLIGFQDKPINVSESEIYLMKRISLKKVLLNNKISKIYEEFNKQIVYYKNSDELARFQLIRIEEPVGFKIGNNYYLAQYQNKKFFYFDKKQANILSNYSIEN